MISDPRLVPNVRKVLKDVVTARIITDEGKIDFNRLSKPR